jgi:hypothetical protein
VLQRRIWKSLPRSATQMPRQFAAALCHVTDHSHRTHHEKFCM